MAEDTSSNTALVVLVVVLLAALAAVIFYRWGGGDDTDAELRIDIQEPSGSLSGPDPTLAFVVFDPIPDPSVTGTG